MMGLGAIALGWAVLVAPAQAAPKFPTLSGRVVDEAALLSPSTETTLTSELKALEDQTGAQLVVVTLPDLQGYPIEEFGYQLGRHWGIGRAEADDGVLLIVAKAERKVRIEVGYGLEGVLTDAWSSLTIRRTIVPRFRQGDFDAGVTAGARAIIDQVGADPATQQARLREAAEPEPQLEADEVAAIFWIIFIVVLIFIAMTSRGGGGTYVGTGTGTTTWGGGGFGSGSSGGGFSGGGGSFGGGGASGGW